MLHPCYAQLFLKWSFVAPTKWLTVGLPIASWIIAEMFFNPQTA
jgi:hypothetical protein